MGKKYGERREGDKGMKEIKKRNKREKRLREEINNFTLNFNGLLH
jgi:hypothetical protein